MRLNGFLLSGSTTILDMGMLGVYEVLIDAICSKLALFSLSTGG